MKLDILSFWRANQFQYPALARMAYGILSIPVLTMAPESDFRFYGRALDQYQSGPKPDNVEAFLCTWDWLLKKTG